MSYTEIIYSIENNIAHIELNNPKIFNAMSQNMAQELHQALLRANTEARVVIISGHGNNFCSGANLKDAGFDLESDDRDLGIILEQTYNPMLSQIKKMDIPVITVLRGAVVGIGCAVALMGDIILAQDDCYIKQSFKDIALVPDGGSAYILAKTIGRVKAMEMMLLGTRVDAKDAYEMGLITGYFRKHDLEPRVKEIAKDLATGPTLTLGLIRKMAWAALDNSYEEHLKQERNYQRDASRTNDFVEGVRAFREKRKVSFKGE